MTELRSLASSLLNHACVTTTNFWLALRPTGHNCRDSKDMANNLHGEIRCLCFNNTHRQTTNHFDFSNNELSPAMSVDDRMKTDTDAMTPAKRLNTQRYVTLNAFGLRLLDDSINTIHIFVTVRYV